MKWASDEEARQVFRVNRTRDREPTAAELLDIKYKLAVGVGDNVSYEVVFKRLVDEILSLGEQVTELQRREMFRYGPLELAHEPETELQTPEDHARELAAWRGEDE
jgi:hypothetical protein